MLHERRGVKRPFEEPYFNEKEFNKPFPRDGSWIFLCATGDIMCPAMPDKWVKRILTRISTPEADANRFLLQTKNPMRLFHFIDRLMPLRDNQRIILGTTIETNRDTPWSRAPSTEKRYVAMSELRRMGFDTFLSLEPLADFDIDTLTSWVIDINPLAIEIGLENYSDYLPKPPVEKIQALYDELKAQGFNIKIKKNLKSLIKEGK
jgi:DNA repair photolyase